MIKKIFNVLKLYKTPYQKTKQKIVKQLKSNTVEEVEVWIEKKIETNEFQALHAHRIMFSLLKNKDLERAILHGEKAQKIEVSSEIKKVLKNRKKYSISKLDEFYHTHTIKETEQWMKSAIRVKPDLKMQLYKTFFTLAKKNHSKIAVLYGEKAVLLGADKKFKKVVDTRKRWFENTNTLLEVDLSDISIKEAKNILDNTVESSLEEGLEYLNSFKSYDENIVFVLKIQLLRKINKKYPQATVDIGLEILDKLEDRSLLKVIAARAYALKDYESAFLFYHKYFSLTKDNSIIDRLIISIVNRANIKGIQDPTTITNKIIYTHFDFLSRKRKLLVKNKILFEIYFNAANYDKSVKYGLKIIQKEDNKLYSIKLAKAYFELGKLTNALENSGLDYRYEEHHRLMEVYRSYLVLKDEGFAMPSLEEGYEFHSSHKILYVLNNSLPYHSNGYATRAHGLLDGVKTFKNIHAITRLGYPHDLVNLRDESHTQKHVVDSIEYFHLPCDDHWLNYMALDKYLKAYGEKLAEHIREQNIQVIHSASNFVNGLAANYAARKLNIKSIYEVRGLWEITRISRQPEWENSEHFDMIKRLETEAAKTADTVITITHALKNELIKRGVDENKISVLPNGVNTHSFMPLDKDLKLMQHLGIKENEIIIGYVGSIVEYEGIDILVEAIAKLKTKKISNFKFLLVGDGRYFENIKDKIAELKISDLVIMTGRIPHEEVSNYYSLIDIAPLPRKALPVSEMVSPLKPFEAMSMGKIVIGSSVAAIAEIIEDGYNGMLFEKNNVDDLADKIEILLKDDKLRTQIGENSREWVVKERDWAVLAKKLNDIYDDLL